jgi:hypothetical protein
MAVCCVIGLAIGVPSALDGNPKSVVGCVLVGLGLVGSVVAWWRADRIA